jgi:hypothetical protein
MRRENAHRVIGVDVGACCMQVSVSPPRARGVFRFGAMKWWDILLGRLTEWRGLRARSVARSRRLRFGLAWFSLRPFDICALLTVTGNCDWQS